MAHVNLHAIIAIWVQSPARRANAAIYLPMEIDAQQLEKIRMNNCTARRARYDTLRDLSALQSVLWLTFSIPQTESFHSLRVVQLKVFGI